MALHCPATLFIAAHGEVETDWERASGEPSGPLSARGRAAARELARLLAGENIAGVYTSTVPAALETGRVAATVLGVESAPVRGLDGASAAESAGPGGDVLDEVREAILGVADRHRGEQVLVVTDAATLAMATPRATGAVHHPDGASQREAGAAPVRLEVGDDGWRLTPWPA